MKDEIIKKASDMFLIYGFKSVTMDDLASEMGISKKTIYQHFENKTKLVEASTAFVFQEVFSGIDRIRKENKNPIEEILDINKFVKYLLKDERSSPQYQLQKYYPKIYKTMKSRQFEMMHECVTENLERGMATGVYRKEIDKEVISRIYFLGTVGIRDKDLFPEKQFSSEHITDHYLEYHLRGIATEKGAKQLNKFLNKDS